MIMRGLLESYKNLGNKKNTFWTKFLVTYVFGQTKSWIVGFLGNIFLGSLLITYDTNYSNLNFISCIKRVKVFQFLLAI